MNRERKLAGAFMLALGLLGASAGISLLFGGALPTASGTGCKALCGLAMLSAELFGERAGQHVGGLLWLTVGGAFCYFGLRVLKG